MDGVTFSIDKTSCDGSKAEIISTTTCQVPISTLRAGVFQLPWGSSVYAKVTAYNLYGYSTLSPEGNGAVILTYPDAPVSLAETIALRTATSITFTWSLGAANGGTSVIDFRISYDQSIGVYVTLASGVSPKQYTATGLTTGNYYTFKVQSRNSFGLSEFSDEI